MNNEIPWAVLVVLLGLVLAGALGDRPNSPSTSSKLSLPSVAETSPSGSISGAPLEAQRLETERKREGGESGTLITAIISFLGVFIILVLFILRRMKRRRTRMILRRLLQSRPLAEAEAGRLMELISRS